MLALKTKTYKLILVGLFSRIRLIWVSPQEMAGKIRNVKKGAGDTAG